MANPPPAEVITNVDDRRRLPRIQVPGGVPVADEPHEPPFQVMDISSGGVKFHTDRRLPQGTRMAFWFDYFDLEFRVRADVAWSKLLEDGCWEHGARFVELTRAEQAVIDEYVRELEEVTSE